MNEEMNTQDNPQHRVNITDNDISQTKIVDESKNKDTTNDGSNSTNKVLKYSIIAGIIVAIVLIIVLSVTLTKKDIIINKPPNPPTPAPQPQLQTPFLQQEYNPYTQPTLKSYTANQMIISLSQSTATLQQELSKSKESIKLGDPNNGRLYKPVDPTSIFTGPNNAKVSNIELTFQMIEDFSMVLNISDAINQEYSIPDFAFKRPTIKETAKFDNIVLSMPDSSETFYFNISNKFTQKLLISTYKRKMYVTEKFSEVGFVLPNAKIFGLGQHNSQFQLQNGTYTLWSRNRYQGLPIDNAEGGLNGGHIHPFILGQSQNGEFYGMFFASSSAQSFEVLHFQGSQNIVLNYIQLGGKLEMYFFTRGSAAEIISEYQYLISGTSSLPPYYALGFFQGSSSYLSLSKVEEVMQNYALQNMALEGVIIDNYYEGPNQVFTVSQYFLAGSDSFQQKLTDSNQHVILGLQSGIASGYSYYDDLISSKGYIESTMNQGKPLIGQQDAQVVYPDFINYPALDQFWQKSLEDLDSKFPFQGLYLQNNAPFTSISGELLASQSPMNEQIDKRILTEQDTGNWDGSYKLNQDQSIVSTYNLPFIPGYAYQGNLDNQTISLNATHYIDSKTVVQDLYVHNMYGHMQMQRSNVLLQASQSWSGKGQRPLIFSESTWAGSGSYGAVALTNMWREWKSLRNSISMAMSFSMYGISNIASDACGSAGPMDEELCGRWAQLSAFLPMIRNYYPKQYYDLNKQYYVDNVQSEFYNYLSYQNEFMASSALNQRLPLTRYIYSQMFWISRNGGSLVYPLFFDYPTDDNLLSNIEHTYMLGDSLKVSPVLDAGVDSTFQVYFPKGDWADMNDFSNIISAYNENITLNQSYAFTNVHLKEGKIIPYQHNPNHYKQTHDFLTKQNMSFVIHRESKTYAGGSILIDDGLSVLTGEDNYAYYAMNFYISDSVPTLSFDILYGQSGYDPAGLSINTLGSIHILNAEDLAGTNFACYLSQVDGKAVNMTYEYNPYNKVLTLKAEYDQTIKINNIDTILFGNSFQQKNGCVTKNQFQSLSNLKQQRQTKINQ